MEPYRRHHRVQGAILLQKGLGNTPRGLPLAKLQAQSHSKNMRLQGPTSGAISGPKNGARTRAIRMVLHSLSYCLEAYMLAACHV